MRLSVKEERKQRGRAGLCLCLINFPSCFSEYRKFNLQVGTVRGRTEKLFAPCIPVMQRSCDHICPLQCSLRPGWEDFPLQLPPPLRPTFAPAVTRHDHPVISKSSACLVQQQWKRSSWALFSPMPPELAFIWGREPRSKGCRYQVSSECTMLILSLPLTSASPVCTCFFSVYPLKCFEDKEALYPFPRKVPHAMGSFQASF